MPEGAEVAVVADVIRKSIGKTFVSAEVIENVPGKLHRFSNNPIQNFDLLQKLDWKINQVRTKGKLIILEIELIETGHLIFAFSTLGMSGSWKYNGKRDKHTRLSFILQDGSDLSFEDTRCYGTFRVITEEVEAKAIENKIGWDLLKAPMLEEHWLAVQNKTKFKNKEIKEVLMDQSCFSGLGNIYACELMHQLKIHPRTRFLDLPIEKWKLVNGTAHKILHDAYKLGGSSVVDFEADGKEGRAQELHKIYMKAWCPLGHAVERIEQAGRTTHFCPECQKVE